MNARTACLTAVICLATWSTESFADGFLYQLPEDGAWARFDVDGKVLKRDGTELTVDGTLTISSVGVVEVDGKPCRWIEIAWGGKRSDLTEYTSVHKLLIPEEYATKGQEPLKHVLKAWNKHSEFEEGPAQIEDPQGKGAHYLKDSVGGYLHGPFESATKLEKVIVDSKLGLVGCEGITATEKLHEDKIPNGPTISVDCTYTIRLHEKAPFGVVAVRKEIKMTQDGEPLDTLTTNMTLTDFGKDAKTAIPEAN